MAKALRDEDLRLNIIINGDAGRKSIEDLKRSTHDGKIALDALIASQKQLEAQGKKNTPEYRALTAEIDKQSKALDDQKDPFTEPDPTAVARKDDVAGIAAAS